VAEGTIGEDRTFVLQMGPDETATCTVTAWDPSRKLA
jgi:hypothetical protein